MTYIIAEVGSNWKTFEDCKRSIIAAKASLADAVKFQIFDLHSLYGLDNKISMAQYENETHERHVLRVNITAVSLPKEWLPELKKIADAHKIDFMCTAFSPELYDVVNPHVHTHKIASAEMTHVRILEKVKSYGKPVYLSTGASGPQDIKMALDVLEGVPVTLLYCVAGYPAYDVDFRKLDKLKEFGKPVGYSDHSIDIRNIPALAKAHGASVIEKHFRLDDMCDTPDAGHSLTQSQFKTMVQSLTGDAPFTWGSPEEQPMISRHNRRLIATTAIQKGDTIWEGKNMGIYRSLKDDMGALSPFAIGMVHGKVATRDIQAGDGIGPGDFE